MAERIFIYSILLLVTFFFFSALWYWLREISIERWKRSLHLNQHYQTYQEIYRGIDGFKISLLARQNNNAPEFVYGEIKFLPFIALMSLVKMDSETVFYDLGSGIGRAVLACAMVFDIKKSCGVEIFSALHQSACQQKHRLEQMREYQKMANSIHFYQSNFLHCDLCEATVIFVNSTAIFGETWQRLIQTLDTLEHCQTVVTTSKSLSSPVYILIRTVSIEMSWGVVTAYIHQKNSVKKIHSST